MKNTTITVAIFFFFFSFVINAQNVGDRKKQVDVFVDQPVWKSLTAKDTYTSMVVSDYFACKTGTALFWNAVDHNEAEVQAFMPEDSILVVTHNGADFIYKNGCKNRLKYIRCIASSGNTKQTVTQPTQGKIAQGPAPSPAVFKTPAPACGCNAEVGEWEPGPSTGKCAWKLHKTGMEPECDCNYVTSWSFYVKHDGSFLYSWERVWFDGVVETGQSHIQPWFTNRREYIATVVRNY